MAGHPGLVGVAMPSRGLGRLRDSLTPFCQHKFHRPSRREAAAARIACCEHDFAHMTSRQTHS